MTLFISCPAILLLHFILSLFLSRSFFYRFLRFSFTCIVSILCLAPHLNSDNLCSLFSSGPFLLFLRVSGANYFFFVLLLSLFFGPFHSSCHYIFFGFLLLSRSPSSIDPGQSFFLVPLPSSFFSLISAPLRCSLRFLLGFLSCHVHKKYMHSGFVPFSFRPRSGPVSFSFPFRSGGVSF